MREKGKNLFECGETVLTCSDLRPFTTEITPYGIRMGYFSNYEDEKGKLPKKYIIKNYATILIWNDDTKTIIKRNVEDEFDPIKAFLWAYFQGKNGLSKTKTKEYLDKIVEDLEK